jgi:hypothetical protein
MAGMLDMYLLSGKEIANFINKEGERLKEQDYQENKFIKYQTKQM